MKYLEEVDPKFDVVILDHTMPKMTGLELGTLMLERFPSVPVILYTGYSQDLAEDDIRQRGFAALLRKPLDIPELGALL